MIEDPDTPPSYDIFEDFARNPEKLVKAVQAAVEAGQDAAEAQREAEEYIAAQSVVEKAKAH